MKLKNIGKNEIIRLIKDDLIHTRLVFGLEALGFNTDNYTLHLSETIFKLLGIKDEQEKPFEKYIEECRTIGNIDTSLHPELLDSMAQRLYKQLTEEL